MRQQRITNIVRIYELLLRDPSCQLCYYQAGIGSYDTNKPLDSQTSSYSSQISKTINAAIAKYYNSFYLFYTWLIFLQKAE